MKTRSKSRPLFSVSTATRQLVDPRQRRSEFYALAFAVVGTLLTYFAPDVTPPTVSTMLPVAWGYAGMRFMSKGLNGR